MKLFRFSFLILLSLTLWNCSQHAASDANAAEELPEADLLLPEQKFTLNTSADTVIETEGGLVFAVPAHLFVDENGKQVDGEVEIEIREALDAENILKSGLESRSGDQLLESAGMFSLRAKQNGQALSIAEGKSIHGEMPTDEVKSDMQLFEGQLKPDGTLDWVKPKPMAKDLVTVDFTHLNFYPSKYLETLAELGKDVTNRAYTDSLYYSFSTDSWDEDVLGGTTTTVKVELMDRYTGILTQYTDTIAADSTALLPNCGIGPARIKAIRSPEFQITFLATREFEERLQWIHRNADEAVLDLYVNNLNLPLHEIDVMAAAAVSPAYTAKFNEFAQRKEGNTNVDAGHLRALKGFYERRYRAEAKALALMQEKYQAKQAELNKKAYHEQQAFQNKEVERLNENYRKEFDINLKEAYRQLGYPGPPRVVNPNRYRFSVTNTGWKNVDRYVAESLNSRTTLDYTDKQGNKAVIKFEELSLKVANHKAYDRIFIYLLPDQLNSFMRMKGEDGQFAENLNELINYDLMVLAYKGDQPFLAHQSDVEPGNLGEIQLLKTTPEQLKKKLSSFSKASDKGDLVTEFKHHQFRYKEAKRQKKLLEDYLFRNKIRATVFPCESEGEGADEEAATESVEMEIRRVEIEQ